MRWSREKDYHGYRRYSEDKAVRRNGGRGSIGAMIGALRAVLRFVARPTPSPVILRKSGRSGFSTLGGRSGLLRPADCPFPTEPRSTTRARHS
jgi:hypothetical protein